MSAARSILAFVAVAAVVPLALREVNVVAPVVADGALVAEGDAQADPAAVRAFLQGVRGANAIQCEMILQTFDSWSSNRAPDRDSVAWAVATVVRRRVIAAQSLADLISSLRGDDACAARAATRMLGRSQQAAARRELLAALRDSSVQVRRLAAIGVGYSNDTTASGALVRVLADGDDQVRAAAAWALGAVR
jgi:HEAT repeat protein